MQNIRLARYFLWWAWYIIGLAGVGLALVLLSYKSGEPILGDVFGVATVIMLFIVIRQPIQEIAKVRRRQAAMVAAERDV